MQGMTDLPHNCRRSSEAT